MMSSKMAIPGLLKITVFRNKGYKVITTRVDDLTNKILSPDWNYIVDVFMLPNFGNSGVSMREIPQTNFIRIWPEKTAFFRDGHGSSLIIWDWH